MKIQNILKEKQKNFNPTHTLEPTYHSEKAENIEVFDFKKYRRGSQNKNFSHQIQLSMMSESNI